MPEAGKKWKDRKRVFPPEVPPFCTLLGYGAESASSDTIVTRLEAAMQKIDPKPIKREVHGTFKPWAMRIEEVFKLYAAWRANWNNMVPEWVPPHAGEGEFERFCLFVKEVGRVSTLRRRRLVRIDTSKPFGPGNAQWSGSLFAYSSRGYHYAKAKAAYTRIDESPLLPGQVRWKNFEEFVKEVGFPPERSADNGGRGGHIYQIRAKDPSLPIGQGNAEWGVKEAGVTSDMGLYLSNRHFWKKLFAEWSHQGPFPEEWNTFIGFLHPDTGPGPVPSRAPSGSLRPRWTLGRKDPSKPHAVGNTIWVERGAEGEGCLLEAPRKENITQDIVTYSRTRYFWKKFVTSGACPKSWEDFRVFMDKSTGPGPVPASVPGGNQRPRWALGRKDPSKPHSAENSIWSTT